MYLLVLLESINQFIHCTHRFYSILKGLKTGVATRYNKWISQMSLVLTALHSHLMGSRQLKLMQSVFSICCLFALVKCINSSCFQVQQDSNRIPDGASRRLHPPLKVNRARHFCSTMLLLVRTSGAFQKLGSKLCCCCCWCCLC